MDSLLEENCSAAGPVPASTNWCVNGFTYNDTGGVTMQKKAEDEMQLSLFEEHTATPAKPTEPTTVLDFVRARFNHGPDMTPEEYRHWIKVLIHSSLRRTMK